MLNAEGRIKEKLENARKVCVCVRVCVEDVGEGAWRLAQRRRGKRMCVAGGRDGGKEGGRTLE